MPRTNLGAVKTILPVGSTLTDAQISLAIGAAECSVDQIAAGCGSGLSDDCLKNVETYLSAHYAAATENTLSLKSEKDACGGGSATYGFEFGEGVNGTPFGQMANVLSNGCLAELGKRPANLFSIGCH